MLEQCSDLLAQLNQPELQSLLLEAKQRAPLDRPRDHQGAEPTNMYLLTLTPDQRLRIAEAIRTAVVNQLRTPATKTRGLGGFIEAWKEYVEYTPLQEGAS